MSVFLPLLENADSALVDALARIGPVIVPSLAQVAVSETCRRYILFDHDSSFNLDEIVAFLDEGAERVIVPVAWAKEIIGTLPAERLLLLLDVANVSAVTDKIREGVSGVLIKTPALDLDLISSVTRYFSESSSVYVLPTAPEQPSQSTIRKILGAKSVLVLPTSQLTLGASTKDQINVGEAFLSPITSDRPDGLFATVVSSYLHGGKSLGLVYSSVESIKESIITGKGVYQSRKHGLWRKGETSGSTQDVVYIHLDCDSDSLEFSVIQHGSGFCHLNRPSCFGGLSGLSALETTLQSRLSSAPEGSYTMRLFNDPTLLRSKIMEEADELCQAESKEEVAFEAADLFYFALTRCVAAGVSIVDIERSLDRKAKKVTRRPGNAKPQFTPKPAPQPVPAPAPSGASTDFIRMRTYDLSTVSSAERNQLLRRPVLKSDEMISKVKPIVDDVRIRGDAALLELTAKFDQAKLTSPIMHAPFPEDTMQIDDKVRQAIDQAYANIRKFHEAQTQNSTLKVETMPGVVCSRFARPVARVGLYVPGGTAVLPSTALMLGIPAQVAGCKEIVIATPPKPDGSVSPEVMYVAKLVGASTVLKAGGGQAVAAMAYGTQTVPKVDKIFGPGNQWVTAAKMLVQNDTDALVSIDMPAGPSEVLVIADNTCNSAFVAADLLSQAEHGVDSQVVLVAVNLSQAELSAIEKAVDEQAKALTRVDIVRQSVAKSLIVKASSVEEAVQFSNDYAPEHLILHLREANAAVSLVENAGSVFVGPYSPESCGDYASGTNHTLPTNGYARQFSGVNTLSFQKHITSQEVTVDGLKVLGPVVATLADCEGLDAHANAVRIRLRHISS
ncbi:histidine biosynthesis trifunctional-protein [Gloeophyllum trabeum ATCC 11539]|uniref:Histidine biosynthesis trifunctional protein n=1 Tax=Gloeophyllum trabeum (strain ATCC 11539 / FP-39264 / Madison 617) TaxID=670483 RepID=S7QJD9_GLOTA|nr:histidine biosynthesis trifunctional-protein [Gloeophyllum trabeum ATCC 11539]EPQ59448.1 histidine biosynthesis trifunctional-protein [Gloeophyllum trabeum ATCC 11539]